jgi:hypothetical protein
MKIKEELMLIESVVENCGIITHVEPIFRLFIIKDIVGLDIFNKYGEDKDVFDIYDELNLSNLDTILETLDISEYSRLLNLCYKRYEEQHNPINNLQFNEETLNLLKEFGDRYGDNKVSEETS